MDLQSTKNLFNSGIQYAKTKRNIFLNSDNEFLDKINSIAQNAPDLTTLMSTILAATNSQQWQDCFNDVQCIPRGYELQKTPIQYGRAPLGWYFFTGVADPTSDISPKIAYNFTFLRVEIAPPHNVKIPKSQAVNWLVSGGYGIVGNPSTWYSLPYEFITMDYQELSYSMFTLSGSGNTISASISSTQPMTFDITVSFTDSVNKKHTLTSNLTANTPPQANYENACDKKDNLGTFYYSYPDMRVSMTVSGDVPVPLQAGKGWIDHQYAKGGIMKNIYYNALLTRDIVNSLNPPGWIWASIQDEESGEQNMLMRFNGDKPYSESVKLNDELSFDIANVYKKGVPYFNQNIKAKLLETTSSAYNIDLPSKYHITLPSGKEVILATITAPNIYSSPAAPYETPAYLYNMQGQVIGTGLIEANLYLPIDVYVSRYMASMNSTDSDLFNMIKNILNPKQTLSQKLLMYFVILLPFILIIASVVYIFHKKDRRKERLGLVVCIWLILFMLYLLS